MSSAIVRWIQGDRSGEFHVNKDLYLRAVPDESNRSTDVRVYVGRRTRSELVPLDRETLWGLAQLEDDRTAELALTEIYDDADPPVMDFAERLHYELASPCPCGSGRSSLLCRCHG